MKYKTADEPRKTLQIIRLYNCQLGKHSLIQIIELRRYKNKRLRESIIKKERITKTQRFTIEMMLADCDNDLKAK